MSDDEQSLDQRLAGAKEFLAKPSVIQSLPEPAAATPKPDFVEWTTSWAKGVLCKTFDYGCAIKETASTAAPVTKTEETPPELTNSRTDQQRVMDEISKGQSPPPTALPGSKL